MAGTGGVTPAADSLADLVAARLPESVGLVVALSGGADSAVLAWAVSRERSVRAVSVDHGLPGSADLMKAAAAIAASLDIPHQIVVASRDGASETALREARLAALDAAVDDDEVVLTGHTLDDQAETVLGNVMRGSGTAGLAGIPSERRGYARPLLDVERAVVRRIATELGLPFVDDPQNLDPTIRRNRLRHETIPALAEAYNPLLVPALGRLARHASADDALLEERAGRVPLRRVDGAVLVPAASLATLPRAVAARVARRALRVAGSPHPGSAADVEAVLAAVDGTAATVEGGVDVLREGPWVALVRSEDPVPQPVLLETDATTSFGGWAFDVGTDAAVVGRFGAALPRADRIVVRAAAPGEKIEIRSGSKRVVDALAEARIPRRLRPRWPVIDIGGRIMWITGVRVAAFESEPVITVRARRLQ